MTAMKATVVSALACTLMLAKVEDASATPCTCLSAEEAGWSARPCGDATKCGNMTFDATYGINCGEHDKMTDVCVKTPESWCSSQWCWVAEGCTVPEGASPPAASSYFPDTGLIYAYAACGAEDTYTETTNATTTAAPETTAAASPVLNGAASVGLVATAVAVAAASMA